MKPETKTKLIKIFREEGVPIDGIMKVIHYIDFLKEEKKVSSFMFGKAYERLESTSIKTKSENKKRKNKYYK